MSRVKRCVSPSLRAAAQLEGDRVHGEQSFRLAANVAMATLDSLADEEQLTSNAYNSMAKRLKLVYDSRDAGLRRAKTRVVVKMAAESPSVLLHAPTDLDWVTPTFVRKILTERAEFGDIDDEFLRELVGVFLGDPLMELPSLHVRNGLLTLLEADAELLGDFVLDYLYDELGDRDSTDIFELCCPTCACVVHNRAHGLMVLAAEFYPVEKFYDWLADGVETDVHPKLLAKLRRAAGIKEPPPICSSPSIGKQAPQQRSHGLALGAS